MRLSGRAGARRVLLATAVLACAAAPIGHVATAAPARHACTGVSHDGRMWLSIRPRFPVGPAAVTLVAGVAFVPDRIFATNGEVLMRSRDGGCTWSTVLDVHRTIAGLVDSPVQATITTIDAPSAANTSTFVYAGITVGTGPLTQPMVAVSRDTGTHWTTVDSGGGLPDLGAVRRVAACADVPTVAYAVVDGVAGQPGAVYRSADGGKTWAARAAVSGPTDKAELKANPAAPSVLYARDADGLVFSTDSALTFQPLPGSSTNVSDYDLATGRGSVRMVRGHASQTALDRSDDGGNTWYPVPSPVRADHVAMSPLIDVVAVSDGRALWLVNPTLGIHNTIDVTPDGAVPSAMAFTAPVPAGFALVGVADGAVVRMLIKRDAVGGVLRVPPVRTLIPLRLLPGRPQQYFPPTIGPRSTAIRLPAGGHRDVTYDLVLPRRPAPVDVMFLVDSTDSMTPVITGLRQNLVAIMNGVRMVGLDLDFGIADFKDYPRPYGFGDSTDYPYRLDARVGSGLAALRAALTGLTAEGGGDMPEADLTALEQSTVGAGQRDHRHVLVRAGMQAGYRTGSQRLAVIATDNPYHRERDYPTPSWTSVADTLNRYRVHQVGLALDSSGDDGSGGGGYAGLPDEQRMAAATGTFAPFGGIDCNSDGVPDLRAGVPLACKIPSPPPAQSGNVIPGVPDPLQGGNGSAPPPQPPADLAPAVIAFAQLASDRRTLGLLVHGAASRVQLLSPAAWPTIDLKADNEIGFTLRYSCPRLRHPRAYPLGVDVTAAPEILAGVSARLECGPQAPSRHARPERFLAAAASVGPVAAVANAAPPGHSVPNPMPNPNPNPNPNTQAAVNANVGMAEQEQEQRQLAFAEADFGAEGNDTTLAMSRADRGSDATAWLIGAAALTAAAAGLATAARRRTAFAQAFRR